MPTPSLKAARELGGCDEAVTHPAILQWVVENQLEGLFLENAQGIYAVDGQLAYAHLVELPEGRTTLELTGEVGTYQLDPDRYYWYVVHPRNYMELHTFVSNDWWRTLFTQDTTYGSTVVDAVAGAQTVQQAADAVGVWINQLPVTPEKVMAGLGVK